MSRAARALWVLVVLGLAAYVILTVWLALSGIFFPYQLDYGEGIVLWFAHEVAHGQPIYNTLPGLVTSNYPPVFIVLAAALQPLFGDTYTWGRFLNLAATLVSAACVYNLTASHWPRRSAIPYSALASALFLASTFIYHWAPLLRIDLMGLAFTLLAVVILRRREARRADLTRAAALFAAVVMFLLALYTKHSLFFAPAAAALALFLRDRRAGLVFSAALLLAGGAVFAALELVTGGGWSFGLVSANATVWSPGIFVGLIASFVATYAVVLVLAAWGWMARVRALRQVHRPPGVLELYAIAALASLALAGREGAWENYFLEAVAIACVFAPPGLARLAELVPSRGWLVPFVLLLQLGLFWREHDPRIALSLFDQSRAGNEHVGPLVRAATGPILSEDMGLLVTNGKPVVYYTFPYSTLARAGRYDQRWELDNLRAGTFPLVILMQGTRTDVDRFGNFTRGFISALDYGYAVTAADVRYQVYAPAPLQAFAPRASFGDLFELVGWSLARTSASEPVTTLKPGDDLTLTVLWQAARVPPTRYTTFAHLEAAGGTILAQDDHEPLAGAYPTARWAQGEMVRDTYRLRVGATLPPGPSHLTVGWYDTATQDRLGADNDQDVLGLQTFPAR